MLRSQTIKNATIVLGFVALSSLFTASLASAQTVNPPTGPQIVRVDTPRSGARVHGNVTFLGVAVDCGGAQPASRVAVYDGAVTPDTYFADVSMDTNRSLLDTCANQTGSVQSGFTLIIDSNRLSEGRHVLSFVAQYPNGTARTATTEIEVDNILTQTVYRYPALYTGVYYGGYTYDGIYTPTYSRCLSYNYLGQCVSFQNVTAPVVTSTVYPGCVTNVYGNCVSYPYTSTYYNAYYASTYLNSHYYWNGATWIIR